MKSELPGIIEPGKLYLADEAKRRLRIGEWGWRKMRRAGLRVIYQNNRAYVMGDDLIAFFQRASDKNGGA